LQAFDARLQSARTEAHRLAQSWISVIRVSSPVETQILRAAHDVEGTHWQQYLTISRIGNHSYFDEGNRGNGLETNDRP
jgi:hypothetical protein